MMRLPLRSTLFPYTTLFRSARRFTYGRFWNVTHFRFPDPRCALRELVAAVQRSTRHAGRGVRRVRDALVARHARSEEHTSELQSPDHLVCRLLLEKKKRKIR